MKEIRQFLGDIEELCMRSPGEDGKEYTHPKWKNLGCVNIAVLREAIAPVVFRNAEQEITDIEVGSDVYVRAVPNKFKYPERSRGLQILRAMKIGGNRPQNRTTKGSGVKPSEVFDLNALVFGDSASEGQAIYPIKAAVNYSDGLSLLPKTDCVASTFHNRAMEDGSLFDAVKKESSSNIFSRHFIKPGTLMLQVLSTRGKLLPPEGLDHLMLCMGIAGSYGGQTSITGTNIRSRIVGVYGGMFEPEQSSPYILVKEISGGKTDLSDCDAVEKSLHQIMQKHHQVSIDGKTAQAYQTELIQGFEKNDASLITAYKHAAEKVGEFFDRWFMKDKEKGGKKK